MANEPLRGWKAISSYLGTSTRTAQRWEAFHGMPVRRMGAQVSAYPDELDSWRKANAALTRQAQSDHLDSDAGVPPAPLTRDAGEPACDRNVGRHRRLPSAIVVAAATCVALAGWWAWPRPVEAPAVQQHESPVVVLRITAGSGAPTTLAARSGARARIQPPNRPPILVTSTLSGDELDVRVETVEPTGGTTFVSSLRLQRNVVAKLSEPHPIQIVWVGVAGAPGQAPGDGSADRR
jgi:hypothetical protein